ncbi:MAG TPA: hypothetical protein VLH10_03890 [Yinghuangia sp.]|nr:hypothetical protein [Yinghuangia sp.]
MATAGGPMEAVGISVAVAVVVCLVAAVAFAPRTRRYGTALAEAVRLLQSGRATPYQAAAYTSVTTAEVAVWLLLEDGLVMISRDGRIRAAHVDRPAAGADPVTAAVLGALAAAPNGLKLHEIDAAPGCREAFENARSLGIPGLPGADENGAAARRARQILGTHGRQALDARFADLDHHQEREAAALYRRRAPVYVPPGGRQPVSARRTRGTRRTDSGSDAMIISSGDPGGSGGGGGSDGGSSCGGGGGCGGGGCGGGS